MAMDEHDVKFASDMHGILRLQQAELTLLVSENKELRERINQLEDRIARIEGRLEGDQ
jgi:uncharacterized small protein (DUF1192 family)